MIGRTINGPIAGKDWRGIQLHAAVYLALTLFMVATLIYRQRFALELGEAVVHDMRAELFRKLATLPMSFFNQTKFGRIISRMTSDIDNIRVGVQDVAFVLTVQALANGGVGGAHGLVRLEAFSPSCSLLVPDHLVINERYRQRNERAACARSRNPGAV